MLLLAAAGVDALTEVALAVEQPDADERQRIVRGLLEEVAGERAETAGVDRERHVHGELGAEEGARTRGRQRRIGRRAGEVALERLLRRRQAPAERGLSRHALELLGRDLGELTDRVVRDARPALGIDLREQRGAVLLPGPVVVVGELGERANLARQPARQLLARVAQIGAPVEHVRDHRKRGRHARFRSCV